MLVELFAVFFQIGLFAIGGGYAALPLIQGQTVQIHHWLTLSEFTDLVTISQMTPGPIAINGATFVGMKTAGYAGAVAATLGCIAPSLIIVTGIYFLYRKHRGNRLMDSVLKVLRPVSAGLIASAGADLLISGANTVPLFLLFIAAFILLRSTRLGSISIMLLCGLAGILIFLL